MTTDDNITSQRTLLHQRGICVIIPTYNNVGTIGRVVADVIARCQDVFVVDDGSDDGTTEVLQHISGINLISYRRNRGKGYALKQGIKAALSKGFAYAVTMDADGQHFAKDIPSFLEANRRWPGCIILGKRRREGINRSKGSNFANSFSNFWFAVQTFHHLPDTQTGFRLYPLRKLYGYQLITSRYEAELELLVFAAWHGVGIRSIDVDVYYPPREERVSHFRPGPDFTRISILNTCLCVLAVVYGLPLFILRTVATLLRTVISLSYFLLVMMAIMPVVWLYVKIGPMTERKAKCLHRIIYEAAHTTARRIGVPGIRFREDIDSFDDKQPRVIICNHQSQLDLLYLLSLTPRMVFLTNDRIWHNKIYGFLIRHAEYYPTSLGIDAIMPHLRSLASRGYSIAVFPEGTRSRDCHISRFHRGAFYIAKELGIGIQPLILYGTGRCLRKGSLLFHRGPVKLIAGRLFSVEALKKIGDVKALTHYFHKLYIEKFEQLSNEMEKHV